MTDAVNNTLLLLEIALILGGALYVGHGITLLENQGCQTYWDKVVPSVNPPEDAVFTGQKGDVSPLSEPESSSTGLRLNGS